MPADIAELDRVRGSLHEIQTTLARAMDLVQTDPLTALRMVDHVKQALPLAKSDISGLGYHVMQQPMLEMLGHIEVSVDLCRQELGTLLEMLEKERN